MELADLASLGTLTGLTNQDIFANAAAKQKLVGGQMGLEDAQAGQQATAALGPNLMDVLLGATGGGMGNPAPMAPGQASVPKMAVGAAPGIDPGASLPSPAANPSPLTQGPAAGGGGAAGGMSWPAIVQAINQRSQSLSPAARGMLMEKLAPLILKSKQGQDTLAMQNRKIDALGAPVAMSEDDKDFWADVIRKGGQLPPGMSRTSGGSRLVQELMARVPKGGTAGTLLENRAGQKADTAALTQDVKYADALKRSITELDGMFPIAYRYMKQLPLGEVQRINQGIVQGMREFGSAAANNYANSMMSIALTYGRMIAGPQSAAMLPVEVVKLGMNRLANLTPEQFLGEVQQMKAEGKNITGALDKTISERRASLRGEPVTAEGPKAPPKPGAVEDGHRFKGGDPADPNSWEKVAP